MLPLTLLAYGFLAGCAGLLFQVLFLVLFGEEIDVLSPSLFFLVSAALVEEAVRLIFLLQASRRYGDHIFRLPLLILFGIGFAAVEIIFAVFLNPEDTPPTLLLATNALFHIGATLFLALALQRFGSLRSWFILGAWLSTSAIHTLYNIYRIRS